MTQATTLGLAEDAQNPTNTQNSLYILKGGVMCNQLTTRNAVGELLHTRRNFIVAGLDVIDKSYLL